MMLRVAQWTTGNVGKQSVAAIAANHTDLSLPLPRGLVRP
jgi:hypothetical protein